MVFKNLNQKKTKKTQGKPKKTIFWPETKTSPKSFGFLVFWFSRGFVKILFCWKRRVLLKEEEFLRLYTTFWTYKIDAKKNKHLNIVKNNKIAQIPVNSEKVWVLGGGGTIYIYTPLKTNTDTKNDGPWKMYLLSNIAILGSYVRFQGCIYIYIYIYICLNDHSYAKFLFRWPFIP